MIDLKIFCGTIDRNIDSYVSYKFPTDEGWTEDYIRFITHRISEKIKRNYPGHEISYMPYSNKDKNGADIVLKGQGEVISNIEQFYRNKYLLEGIEVVGIDVNKTIKNIEDKKRERKKEQRTKKVVDEDADR